MAGYSAVKPFSSLDMYQTEYTCTCIIPFQGIHAKPLNEEDMFTWEGTIKGPKDTMWEGRFDLKFTRWYAIINNSF